MEVTNRDSRKNNPSRESRVVTRGRFDGHWRTPQPLLENGKVAVVLTNEVDGQRHASRIRLRDATELAEGRR